MTDNINPSHYKDGPFECIELSSLLSFDWGNVIKYCYRWRDKNGVEDSRKHSGMRSTQSITTCRSLPCTSGRTTTLSQPDPSGFSAF